MKIFKNKQLHGTWHRFLIPVLVLVTSLILTILGGYAVHNHIKKATFNQFELHVEPLKTAIISRMSAYEQLLRGGVSWFASSPAIERQDWHHYVNHLQINKYYPGVHLLGFSQRVFALEKATHIAQIRAEGFPNYSIRPPGERDEYMPLIYLEPLVEEYRLKLGFDALAQPTHRVAVEYARDTGKAALTDPVILMTEPQGSQLLGLIMYLPVYRYGQPLKTVAQRRSALLGLVSSGFRLNDLMLNLVGQQELDINFEIYEGSSLNEDSLLYRDTHTQEDYRPQLTKIVPLEIGGRTWTVRFTTLPQFEQDTRYQVPDLWFVSGFFMSILLFIMTISLLTTRQINVRLQTEIRERRAIENRLRHQEELLNFIIDSIPQFIFWKDINNMILGCNRRLALLAGANDPNQLIGKSDFDLPWQLREPHSCRVLERRVMEMDQPEYHSLEIVQRADGQQRWLDASRIPLHDFSGKVIGILVTFEDITEQKLAELELQQSREAEKKANFELNQFKTILDMTLDIVFIYDATSLKFTYANYGAIKHLGYTKIEFLQMTPLDINPEISPDRLQQRLLPLIEGSQSAMTVETINKHKNGTLIPVEVSVQYIKIPGQISCFISIARDITERKQAEITLLQATQAAEKARREAEVANHAKSTFLANMSHELRTPLNSILGYAQIFLRDKNLPPKQQEGMNIIQRSGDYLLTLINDILDLSKIEAGKVEIFLTNFHFNDFIQSIIQLFQMRAREKGISFIYEPLSYLPLAIRGDEKRLRQILINLLSNAIKFTEHGGVTLKVCYHQDRIHFQIRDTGIGIAPEEREKIFFPFQQVGNANYRAEGTGLGLAITKKLVEALGGEIQVESQLGHGSTFSLVLELPEVSELVKLEPAEQPVIIGFQGPPRQILVVDDKWENRSVMDNLLKPLGFNILEASNGQECLEKTCKMHPDLILTDLVMPVMDGFEATRQIRKINKFKKLPIIATSASVFELDQQKSFSAGCNDFIAKPIRAEILLEKIRHYLGLTWIYEPEYPPQVACETDSSISREESELLVGPSPEQAAILFDLAMRGDIGGIIEEVDKLEQSEQQLVPFCRKVCQLAKNFEEQQICELIEPYMSCQ